MGAICQEPLIKASWAKNMCVIYDMLNLAGALPLAAFSPHLHPGINFIEAEQHSSGPRFLNHGKRCCWNDKNARGKFVHISSMFFFHWVVVYLGDECGEPPSGPRLSSASSEVAVHDRVSLPLLNPLYCGCPLFRCRAFLPYSVIFWLLCSYFWVFLCQW